jgi:hypothetical protein
MESPVKEMALGMSPATKIRLSPMVLSALSKATPAVNRPPSLGDCNSTSSETSSISGASGPVTPDSKVLQVKEDQSWEVGESAPAIQQQSLEIAIDEGHSLILSPVEKDIGTALSSILSPGGWTDMVVSFPQVPGATPQDLSPLMPTMDELRGFDATTNHTPASNGSDIGVRLPPDALMTLRRLARDQSTDNNSDFSGTSPPSKRSGIGQEMRELSEPDVPSRPRSADGETPVSDYSFTQLSIPSPGGFFSSLQAGARHTWCLSRTRGPSIPNTATAELFYNRPWEAESSSNVVETFLAVEDTNMTEGPPTARQATFNSEDIMPMQNESPALEDDDMYGPDSSKARAKDHVKINYEYDERYQEELQQVGGANIDRTGSWLAAQTGYLAALLDVAPYTEADDDDIVDTPSSLVKADVSAGPAVKFSACTKVMSAVIDEVEVKEPIFLTAAQQLTRKRKRRDAFLHATSRLEAVQATRIAVPERHLKSLLGQHTLIDPARPKYAGPFSQNPRQTGIFEQTAEQMAFKAVEREQAALTSIEPATWQIEALRSLYHGRLLASSTACRRLQTKATLPLDDPACVGSKRLRVLDFGGAATASWAWDAALEWPNVKIYTVITKDQAHAQRPVGLPKPASPPNHRTVSVPHLWQLPFRSGHFDVISARSLHALLKNNPVPGVPAIDEWDLTLRECMRVLKPGGYIDYMIMDSTIAHAGPRGDTMSVEFGFELHRRGYAREAGRSWLKRLKREGFVGVKRAWMFLPMGKKPVEKVEEHMHGYTGDWQSWRQGAKPFVPAPRPISEVSTISKIVKQYMDVEAVQGPVGTTGDVADLTGLLGARIWEEWLVKVRSEIGKEQSRWLEGVDEVLEEGKEHGSGWKVLVGWARKPKLGKGKKGERAEIVVAVEDLEQLSPVDGDLETGTIPMFIQD